MINGTNDGRFDGRALLTSQDVAERLSISERSVWRLSSSGQIPKPVKVGGSTRWRVSDIEAFVKAGSRPSAERLP